MEMRFLEFLDPELLQSCQRQLAEVRWFKYQCSLLFVSCLFVSCLSRDT